MNFDGLFDDIGVNFIYTVSTGEQGATLYAWAVGQHYWCLLLHQHLPSDEQEPLLDTKMCRWDKQTLRADRQLCVVGAAAWKA